MTAVTFWQLYCVGNQLSCSWGLGLATNHRNNLRFRITSQERQKLELDMKKFLLGTVALVALGMAVGPASAADLAARPVYTKAPPPMAAAVFDWTGFYVGINGGWVEEHDRRSDPVFGLFGDYNPNGGTIGGQIGYRWQTGPWVFG